MSRSRLMIRPLAAALALGVLALAPAGAQERSGIEVRELGSVDPFQVDVAGGVENAAWSRTGAASLSALLDALPASEAQGWSDAAAARLAARALLSAGAPPAGGRGDFDLAATRADRLLAAAGARAVYGLLSRTPRVNESPALSTLFAETAFAIGEVEAACRAADALLEGRDQPYWLRARAACLAFSGNAPAAELTAELARASGVEARAFDALLDAYVLERDLPSGVAPARGLELALAARIAPGTRIETGEAAPAWLAEAAARTGPPIDLPSDPVEALEAARALTGAEKEAALGALIQQDADRGVAADALALRLETAAGEDRFVEAARAYGGEVSAVEMTRERLAGPSGPRFVLAAALAGDLETARAWRRGVEQGPPPPPRPEPLTAPAGDEIGALIEAGEGEAAAAPAQAGERPRSGPQPLSDPQPLSGLPSEPGAASPLAAPEPEPEPEPWDPPPPGVLVALDFALAAAGDRLRRSDFPALLAARVETGAQARYAEAALVAGLGAVRAEGLAERIARERSPDGAPDQPEAGEAGEDAPPQAAPTGRSAVMLQAGLASALLDAGAGARAPAMLHAALALERDPGGVASAYLAARLLADAGLREEALRLLLETIAEHAA